MLYLGADHGGYEYKEKIKKYLDTLKVEWQDLGNTKLDSKDDYPDFAGAVARAVAKNPDKDLGILFCRSGVGVTVVADKHKGIRAALCHDVGQISKTKGDEKSNILSIASDYTPFNRVKKIVKIFIETPFSGGRHQRRLDKIEALENKNFR